MHHPSKLQLHLLFILIVSTPAAFSQGGPPGPPGGFDGPPMDRMDSRPVLHISSSRQLMNQFSKQLKLSADEKNKIKPILASRQRDIDNLRKDTESTQVLVQKLQSIEGNAFSAVRDVLTAEQQKKFDEITAKVTRKEQQSWSQENQDDGMPPPPPDGAPPGGGPPPGS